MLAIALAAIMRSRKVIVNIFTKSVLRSWQSGSVLDVYTVLWLGAGLIRVASEVLSRSSTTSARWRYCHLQRLTCRTSRINLPEEARGRKQYVWIP
jgi:hypothetical protein